MGSRASGSGGADATAGERRLLVERIRRSVMDTAASTGIHSLDPRVLEAIARVPRYAFLPEAVRAHAYQDVALPFAHGRNTAQPFMIALMIHLADVGPDDVVFETGTGTGYPAALLSVLGQRVYSVEWVLPLAERASDILAGRGYDNVKVRAGDGYYGWPQHGPFDAVIVKGALDHVPAPAARAASARRADRHSLGTAGRRSDPERRREGPIGTPEHAARPSCAVPAASRGDAHLTGAVEPLWTPGITPRNLSRGPRIW